MDDFAKENWSDRIFRPDFAKNLYLIKREILGGWLEVWSKNVTLTADVPNFWQKK